MGGGHTTNDPVHLHVRVRLHLSVRYGVQMTLRVVICGAPRAGKTTTAIAMHTHGCWLYHLDSLVEKHRWSEQSDIAAKYLQEPGPYMIEGCAAVRALRKALLWSAAKPCDAIVRMPTPKLELSKGQETLRKGEAKIWAEIEPELVARGVLITYM